MYLHNLKVRLLLVERSGDNPSYPVAVQMERMIHAGRVLEQKADHLILLDHDPIRLDLVVDVPGERQHAAAKDQMRSAGPATLVSAQREIQLKLARAARQRKPFVRPTSPPHPMVKDAQPTRRATDLIDCYSDQEIEVFWI